MKKFEIYDRFKGGHVEMYIVEAQTKEQALNLYIDELVGSLPMEYSFFNDAADPDYEGVTVEDHEE